MSPFSIKLSNKQLRKEPELMINKKNLFLFILFFFLCLSLVLKVNASDSINTKLNTAPFTIIPVIKNNQIKTIKSYFDLNVKPNSTESLSATVKNTSKKPITVYIYPTNALTSLNGSIEYVPSNGDSKSYISQPSYEMMENISVQSSVTLEPNQAKTVNIIVKVPNKDEGSELGGTLFMLKDFNQQKVDKPDKGVTFEIESRLAYAIAIQLNYKKDSKKVFSFTKSGIDYTPSNISVFAQLENKSSAILKQIKGTFTVKESKGKNLFTEKVSGIDMAPESVVQYPISWKNNNLSKGNYTLTFKGRLGNQSINTTQRFSIDDHFIEDYQKTTNIKPDGKVGIQPWMWISGILFILILVFVFIILGKREEND
jgi:hypothetical protein